MGARGPKPLPANVHLLRGNPSKRALGNLLDEFRPDVELPDCPSVLWPEAKREWKRLAPELMRYGLVSKLDRGVLAMCCQEWARWQWAEAQIRKANKADPNGERGLIEVAPSGYRMQSVYLQISTKAQERYEKLKTCFGLSPADRTRVSPSDAQIPLPGMEPKEGFAAL
jgi:P27 family predicted phage terminase small subunit